MGVPAPALAQPTARSAAQRARAKAKQNLTITVLEPEDQDYATAIHRLNATGWAGDPAELSDWANEREELIDLLWQARQELYKALGVGLGHENRDYLTQRWLPVCGPTFIAFVRVLRDRLYLNRATGELRELWFEDGTDLATAMGVSRASFWRMLKRARESAGAPVYKQFVVRRTRRRYDATAQATRITSNQYLVAMEDPLTPDDEAWVAARASELLAERQGGASGSAADTPQGEEHPSVGETKNAVSLCDSERSLTLREQRDRPLEINRERGSYRSPSRGDEGFRVASAAIGNGAMPDETRTGATRIAEGEQGQTSGRSDIASDRTSNREKIARAAPPAARTAEVPADAVLSELEVATATAVAVIEGVAGDILHEFGEASESGVRSTVKTIARQMAQAGAPEQVMCGLIYVARERVRACQARGGHIQTTAVGYFRTTLKNLIGEAASGNYAWNIERIRAADEKRQASEIVVADARARQAHRNRHQGHQSGHTGYSGYQHDDHDDRRR